ncbi:MAG TPA: phosphoglycerate kinase, partial [Candidatus Binatia bacterium]|nr:phosphoglycerate kinase [Candidatus Binatia bacterium]
KVVDKYSMAPVQRYLQDLLNIPVAMATDCVGPAVENLLRAGDYKVVLLENLRFHAHEEKNDEGFSRALAKLADVYVNDAFGAAHRAHASIAGMAKHFKIKAAGLLLQKELDYLGPLLANPAKPFVTILGGAKVSDKIGVIKNLLPKVSSLLIGGGMAYTFLKANGVEIGKSLLEHDKVELAAALMRQAKQLGVDLLLPVDHIAGDSEKKNPITVDGAIPADRMGLDIGPKTTAIFASEIKKAKLVLWNGPVGLFEVAPYDLGSRSLALALAESHPAVTGIIAGGDTVAAVVTAGASAHIAHLSTGGGATLEFLEGKTLPGIKALDDQP